MPEKIQAPKGLEGVIVTRTSVSKIDGERGKLLYRGYDVEELSRKLTFEQVVYLLWFGTIPSSDELREFDKDLFSKRDLMPDTLDFISRAPHAANPLVLLRSVTSLTGMHFDADKQLTLDAAKSLTPKFPTVLAYFDRIRNDRWLSRPSGELSTAENFLYMLSGQKPPKEHADALNSYLVLLADHGLNASTFSAIVTASTLTDYYSAIEAAIGTLKGPLHGGAPSQVWEMLKEIGDEKNAKGWLERRIESGGRIMGFGHRVYRTEDPRSKVLKGIAKKVARPQIFELAQRVEETVRELLREKHPERTLETNVEFYSSLVLDAVGIPVDMFTSTFACSRLVGWTAHILEQLADNRLFRPESQYIGPEGLLLP